MFIFTGTLSGPMGLAFPRRTDFCVSGQCAHLLERPSSHDRSRRSQLCDPQQVVGGTRNKRPHLGLCLSDESALPHPAHRLQPAEDFLNPFSFVLADSIAFGLGDVPIEPRAVRPGIRAMCGRTWCSRKWAANALT